MYTAVIFVVLLVFAVPVNVLLTIVICAPSCGSTEPASPAYATVMCESKSGFGFRFMSTITCHGLFGPFLANSCLGPMIPGSAHAEWIRI